MSKMDDDNCPKNYDRKNFSSNRRDRETYESNHNDKIKNKEEYLQQLSQNDYIRGLAHASNNDFQKGDYNSIRR